MNIFNTRFFYIFLLIVYIVCGGGRCPTDSERYCPGFDYDYISEWGMFYPDEKLVYKNTAGESYVLYLDSAHVTQEGIVRDPWAHDDSLVICDLHAEFLYRADPLFGFLRFYFYKNDFSRTSYEEEPIRLDVGLTDNVYGDDGIANFYEGRYMDIYPEIDPYGLFICDSFLFHGSLLDSVFHIHLVQREHPLSGQIPDLWLAKRTGLVQFMTIDSTIYVLED